MLFGSLTLPGLGIAPVPQHREAAKAAHAGQRHRVSLAVRVMRGQREPGGILVPHEKRRDGKPDLVDEILRQQVAGQHGTGFREQGKHRAFCVEVRKHGAEGQFRARVDDDRLIPEVLPRLRRGGGGRVDQRGARVERRSGPRGPGRRWRSR